MAKNGSNLGKGSEARDLLADTRLLILANSADAQLAIAALHEAGTNFAPRRVEAEGAFIQELRDFAPDVVLVDTALPAYDGHHALQYSRRTHPEIPVIVVSGRVGEEEAVDLLKAGARDYVAKDSLTRLAPAVVAALNWEEGRRS